MNSSKKLKIGYWGNTNNYPFLVARTLKKMGHEIIFIIDEEQKLARPEYRYKDISLPYPDWIKDFSPFPLWLSGNLIDNEKKKKIIDLFGDCDFVVLNGYAVRFADEINKPALIHLTGSDLIPLADYKYADNIINTTLEAMDKEGFLPKTSDDAALLGNKFYMLIAGIYIKAFNLNTYDNTSFMVRKSAWQNLLYIAGYRLWLKKQIKNQRQAIKNSFAYFYAIKGLIPEGDKLLKEIGADEKKKHTTLTIDTDYIEYASPPSNPVIRIFNVARFNWIKSKVNEGSFHELDFKGNDIMIKGLGLFYSKHKTELDIRFVKKGRDLAESMQLCKKLNIDHLITWLDELTQSEVFEEYKNADIIFDQLGNSVVTMGGLEGMAIGRPLIANGRPEIYGELWGKETAICQAKTAEEVCLWLEKLVFDKGLREQKGKESRDFVIKNCSAQSLAKRILEAYHNRMAA